MTAVQRMLCALALGVCVVMAAAGCSPAARSPASGSPASRGPASASPAPTWDEQEPLEGAQLPPGPRMYWANSAGSGHRKRILFAGTHNLGGRAVYYDKRDTATTITCTAACSRRWLPLLASELKRGSLPFSARTLSFVNGPDGRQVEYDGHPLYLYAGDSSQKWIQGSGDGMDGTWFAVTIDLKPAG